MLIVLISAIFSSRISRPIIRLANSFSEPPIDDPRSAAIESTAVYRSIRSNINEIRASNEKLSTLMKSGQEQLRSNLLLDILRGRPQDEALLSYQLAELGAQFPHKYYTLVLLSFDFYKRAYLDYTPVELAHMQDGICKLTAAWTYPFEQKIEYMECLPRTFAFIVNMDELNLTALHRELTQILHLADIENDQLRLIFVTTSFVNRLEELPELYQSAKNALRYRVLNRQSQLIQSMHLPSAGEYPSFLTDENKNYITNYITSGNADAAKSYIVALIEQSAENGIPYEHLITSFSSILSLIAQILTARSIPFFPLFDADPFAELSSLNNLDEIGDFFRSVCTKATAALLERQQQESDILRRSLDYIARNYHNRISLDDVSAYVGYSPKYFSRYFKDQTGITFVNYLNRLRIQAAKELLADPNIVIKDVAARVGFENINVQPAVSGTGDFWFDHIIVVEIPGEANALDTAKNAALDSLDAAVAALDQNAYTYWNWALVQTAKMNGINAVKQASDAASADAAAAAAVSAIQAVKPISATKTEMSAQIAAAKKTVSDAADPDDYREAQKMEVQKLQSAFAQLVDTFDTEQSIEKLTKKCCDLLAAIKTDEQITAEELAAAKAAAKDALDKYAVRSDYTLENWNLVKAEKKKGNAAIDAATSVAAVDKALAAAKAAIDQIESISGAAERLAKAKQDAIEELRAYMQSKDFPADKQSEAERILNDGIAEINAAETLDDVADALATAKEALRKLASGGESSEEERLSEAKQNAEEALRDYADGKTFTGANTRPAVDAIIKATKAINAASTVDEVNAALAEAKAALDRLASDAPIDKPDQPIIVVPVTRPSENKTFKDVSSSDWFYDEVQYVYQKNLMNGTGTSSFSPRDTLTRAMLVTILYRIEGEPSVSYSGKFSDVPSGRWYSKAVEWAAAQGIVGGYSNGKFGPEDSVTREQLAAILYRYAGKTKGFDVSASASLSGYTDSAKVQVLQCRLSRMESIPVRQSAPHDG